MKAPLRLLMAVSSTQMGGAERYVAGLAEGLASRGVEVDMVFQGAGPMAAEYRRAARRAWTLDLSRPYDPRVVTALSALVRESGAELVHTNLWNADVLGGLAARRAGRPALSTVHGAYHLADGRPGLRSLRRKVLSRTYRSVYRCFEKVIAASEYVRADLSTRAGVRVGREKVEVIRIGLDLRGVPPPGRRAQGPGGPRLVCVANLFPVKGQEWLVRALPSVRSRLPGCRLALAGDGPDRAFLGRLAARLGVGGLVSFLGSVRDPFPLMAESDIFVMPSVSEGFGLGILEAWAMGLPVVASRAGAIPELVEDGRDGLLVPPKDPAALADAIVRLATDRDLAGRLVERGRRAGLTRYSPGPMVEKTLELYGRVRSAAA